MRSSQLLERYMWEIFQWKSKHKKKTRNSPCCWLTHWHTSQLRESVWSLNQQPSRAIADDDDDEVMNGMEISAKKIHFSVLSTYSALGLKHSRFIWVGVDEWGEQRSLCSYFFVCSSTTFFQCFSAFARSVEIFFWRKQIFFRSLIWHRKWTKPFKEKHDRAGAKTVIDLHVRMWARKVVNNFEQFHISLDRRKMMENFSRMVGRCERETAKK